MNGITFGSGTFIRIGDPIPELDVGGFTDEAGEKAIKALANLSKAAANATFVIKGLRGGKCLWWRMIHGRPQHWPVSNNWLKMHGYPMRRRGYR